MFMNISDVNGNLERSDELAVTHATDLPENAGTVNINGQHVASARAQSFAHLQPRNDAYSESMAERAQASEDAVAGDEVMVEAEQAPAQQPVREHSQAPSSNSSPSPSMDTSESAGQAEADSETDGARSSMLHNRISSATPQQRQLMAAQAAINKERRRRQILPKIAKEDRCGHCHHCLNPKLKKACITAREAQMKKLDDKEELPLFYKMADNKLNSKAVPAARPKPAPLTQKQLEIKILNEQIQALLTQVDQQVMIKPGKQHHFVDLMHRPTTSWAGRLLFLTSILALPTNDRAVIVSVADRKGLHVLHNWLKTASERPDAEKFQLDVLKTLAVLPVDMAALKKVPVGKTVNTLAKKDPSQKVKAAAAKVVQQWRRNVGMADSDAKRAREADGNVDGAPLKKLKSDPDTSSGAANPGLTKCTSAEGSKLSATGLVSRGSTESVQPAIKAEPGLKAEDASNAVSSALNASVGPKEEPAGALPMEVDDDAMFQKKPSKFVKPETSEIHKVQCLDIAEVARLARENEQGSSSQDSKLKSEDEKPKLDKSSNQTAAPTRARFGSSGPAALGTTRIGAPPSSIIGGSTRIGGLGSIGLGGLGTLSGLNRQTPAVKTASERAAEAAARIPDPPAGTPRQKPKSVTFIEDGELACVRYFLKTEPAINVRADPDFTASQSSDAAALQQNAEEPSEDHPPEFKSAARQEHMDEAAAIRRQMQDVSAGQDEDELSELLDNMSPTQPWAEPPLNPPLGPEADPIAAGEESTARHEEAQRVQSVEAYPPLHMAPPNQMPQDPLEPAFLEPEPAADYAMAVVQLLTPQEITDLQAAQQLLQKPSAASQLGQAVGYQPHLDSKPSVEQDLIGQLQHEGMQQAAPVPFQPPQQGGLIGQYPPAQQPGPPASYPQQQVPGFVGRPPGGPPLFRPPPGPRPAGAAQGGLATMRPLQAHGGPPGQHAMEAPFAEPLPAGREVQLPTNAKPHSALCKYFLTPKGCGRGATCGFKHIILEPAEAPQAEHRNVDTGPQSRRGVPSAQGRGRGPRDGPLHSSRPSGGHNEGPSWQQSRKCAFFNTPKGCDKGDRCRFAHVREEEWSGADRGRFSDDRGERREDWERDRSQQRNDWQAVNRKASGWDQRPDG